MATKAANQKTTSILKLHIDNDWSAEEFAVLFDSMNRLYEFNRILDNSLNQFDENLKKMEDNTVRKRKTKIHLQPSQINNIKSKLISESYRIFNSPNYLDDYQLYNATLIPAEEASHMAVLFYSRPDLHVPLAVKKIKFGSKGSIDFLGLGKILEIVKDLVVHYFPNKSQKIDMAIKQKEIEEKDQRILEMKIENLKKIGLSNTEIRTIVGMESFHIGRVLKLEHKNKLIDIEITKSED